LILIGGKLTAHDKDSNIPPGTYLVIATSENKVYSKNITVK